MKTLTIPGKLVWGLKALKEFRIFASGKGWKRVLIVTDSGVQKAGLLENLEDQMQSARIAYDIVADIPAEPAYPALDGILNRIRGEKYDAVTAIGGGSAMDAAKLFAALLESDSSVLEAVKNPELLSGRLPLAMIPTTCGTGSEATCNAIVAVPEEKIKVGIVNMAFIPDLVILDPEMVSGLPKTILAATGIDALAHCVECFTSNKATPLSDLYAQAGAKLLFCHLKGAYLGKADLQEYALLQLGAYYGGVAITGSGTTAVHALSYPLGGRYHIPHGISNAVLFAPVMRANEEACRTQLAGLCDVCWPDLCSQREEVKSGRVIEKIEEMVRTLEIPDNLRTFGVQKADVDELTEAGSGVSRLLGNNRKVFSKEEIKELYLSLLEE